MGQLIPVETIGGNQLPRLELAKGALRGLLGELEQRTDTRVGVRFYGHRIGWTKTEPVQALAQTEYAGEIPDDLSPSEDVELVLPLGRFDSVEAGKVITRMESLQAWGQSPSYLALLRCLDDFENEDRDTDRSIVVITDGLNYQFTPTNAPQGTGVSTTRQDVLRAWEGRDVPVYILGFGISEQESRQAEAEYREIAQATGGAYYPVNNGRDLLRALRDRLSLGGYSVSDSRGRTVSPHSVDQPLVKLNTPVRLPEPDGDSASYIVNFEALAKEIEVEGGESIELYVSDNGVDLIAKPFDEGYPVAAVLNRPGAAERFLLRAHRPQQSEAGVTFPLSIQSESHHFTPRPASVWVEVTPVVGDDAPRPSIYGFYDSNYEIDQPVPVLNWTASNWPAEAQEAAIRVWAKFAPTVPVQTIALRELLKNRSLYAELQPVNGVSGVRFRIDVSNERRELKVIEQHDSDSSGIYRVKVELKAGRGFGPDRVVHQHDADNGLAIHSYFFQ
ncbi:MAG: vWA domain-containing protein, partial [Pirellulaceae bacterium]